MSLKISDVKAASKSQWADFYTGCPSSTFFQSPMWANIWEKYTESRIYPNPLLLTFSDGLNTVLPFCCSDLRFGMKKFVASPAGTYGGWLYRKENRPSKDHLKVLGSYLAAQNIVLRQNPVDEIIKEHYKFINWTNDDFSQIVSLKTDTFDEIIGSWRGSAQRNLKNALENNLVVKNTRNREDWEEYYSVYQESLKRWGGEASSSYSRDLFNIMLEQDIADISLWIVEYEGKLISGGLFLYGPTHVVYWHGAGLSDYFNKRPSELLHYAVMKDAWERGYKWYDFNPSGGHEGVVQFKNNFGPARIKSRMFINDNYKKQIVDKIQMIIGRVRDFTT